MAEQFRTETDLPPEPVAAADPPPLSRRGRSVSWLAGLLGIVGLILVSIWLVHRAQDSGQGNGGPGHGGGRGGAGGGRGGRGGRGGPGGFNQPTTVGIIKATTADLPIELEELGTVTPAATVTVRPQVGGTITQLLYKEGQLVHKGQALAIIDPRPYRATLVQAQGALTRDQAQLVNARVQLERYQILLRQDSIARQDVDTQAALVKQLEGTVETDRGQVQAAQINVGFTRVVSPVSGRAGLKVVDIGNYIGAGDANGIVVVTTLQPIDIEFSVPQQQVPQIQQRVAQGATIPAVALDSSRTQTLDRGRFSTLDNEVSTTTGTVRGKARFPNAQFQLYPSQFVNVRLLVDTVRNAVAVPPSSVRSGPKGSFVWVLQPDRTVKYRAVTTGISTENLEQVTQGLQPGETVITDGGDRLTDGAKVALPGDQPTTGGGGRHHGRHGGAGGQGNGGGGGGGSGGAGGRAG